MTKREKKTLRVTKALYKKWKKEERISFCANYYYKVLRILISFCFFYASFLYGSVWRIAKGYAIFPSIVAFSFITVFNQTMIIYKAVSSLAKRGR